MGVRIDHPKHLRSPRDAEREALMRRFYDLSAADQLHAFVQIRDFLGMAAPPAAEYDADIENRRASLEALRLVAEHLSLEGRAPTVREFDRWASELATGWTSRGVIRAWGRWRFACETLLGGAPRLSAAQKAHLHRTSGKRRGFEDYLSAVRLWLATNPPGLRGVDYDAWAREYNAALPEGQLPVTLGAAIGSALPVAWRDLIRVARGETQLDAVSGRSRRDIGDWTTGPHDLIGIRSLARILNLSLDQCARLAGRGEFPTPVVLFAERKRIRAWLREDVEIYQRTGVPPARELNCLRPRYCSGRELAALIAVAPSSLCLVAKAKSPPPTGQVGGFHYWLKSDVDRWIDKNRQLIDRRLARPRMRERSV